jgi:hypothetical protein
MNMKWTTNLDKLSQKIKIYRELLELMVWEPYYSSVEEGKLALVLGCVSTKLRFEEGSFNSDVHLIEGMIFINQQFREATIKPSKLNTNTRKACAKYPMVRILLGEEVFEQFTSMVDFDFPDGKTQVLLDRFTFKLLCSETLKVNVFPPKYSIGQ